MPGWGRTASRPGWGAPLRWRTPGGVLCPCLIGSDEVGDTGGVALADDGTLYTGDGSLLAVWDFPAYSGVVEYDLGDVVWPSGTWDYVGGTSIEFSGGMTATGVDDYIYVWVSNDVNNGQQVIVRFDRADILNPTVLYNPGETPDAMAFFRATSLTWHPETPDVLWAIQTDINPSFPDAYTVGRSHLFTVDLATGARTDKLDLTTVQPIGGIWSAATSQHQMMQWSRGVFLPLSDGFEVNTGLMLAYDITTDTFDTYPMDETRNIGYGPLSDDQVVGWDFNADEAIEPIAIGAGGAMTTGTSDCRFEGPYGATDPGNPQWWFAPPDRSGAYVSSQALTWLLPGGCDPTSGVFIISMVSPVHLEVGESTAIMPLDPSFISQLPPHPDLQFDAGAGDRITAAPPFIFSFYCSIFWTGGTDDTTVSTYMATFDSAMVQTNEVLMGQGTIGNVEPDIISDYFMQPGDAYVGFRVLNNPGDGPGDEGPIDAYASFTLVWSLDL